MAKERFSQDTVCEQCKKSFISYRTTHMKYCSKACRNKKINDKNLSNIICLGCKKIFTAGNDKKKRKYCSISCRTNFYNKKTKGLNNSCDLNNICAGTLGAVHELVICIDLLKKGYEVFRSVSPACSCDLAIIFEGKLFRVEVTTGSYNCSGNITYPKKNKNKFDILAICFKNGNIIYKPDLPNMSKEIDAEN